MVEEEGLVVVVPRAVTNLDGADSTQLRWVDGKGGRDER